MQAQELKAHLLTQGGVQVRQRLVKQEHLGPTHHRPAHGDALPLPTGELARVALQQVVNLQHLRRFVDQATDLSGRGLAHPQPEREVVKDGHVRIKRIALEHHRDVPVPRRQIVYALTIDEDLASG